MGSMAPERLTALDASFLYLERPAMHMHVAGLSVLDPSTRPDGRLRFEDVESVFASRLHLAPRLRQKIEMVPFGLALPVWVDDAAFDLDFHIRRAALPSPGGRVELAEQVQRILSRPLDRSKPLWELYVIEGLEDGHVATLMKVHHAMIDGLSGMHLNAALFDLSPEPPVLAPPPAWRAGVRGSTSWCRTSRGRRSRCTWPARGSSRSTPRFRSARTRPSRSRVPRSAARWRSG